MQKRAVVLLNLGGPDSIEAVGPFLFNLFYDRRILDLPNPFRYLLARWISYKRCTEARSIYGRLGGKSPILLETRKQAAALCEVLGGGYEVFVAMRYWHPFIHESIPRLNSGEFSEVILLPLYPQFSSATSLSSIEQCLDLLRVPTRVVCCYYSHPLFIEAHVEMILSYYNVALDFGKPVILFSAHGLPLKMVEEGDPYQFQIESCVERIVSRIGIKELDWEICYQSKVGGRKWLEPDTITVIKKYSNRSLVVVPIAFVSEHSETLVELDLEYSVLAEHFFRVPALSVHAKFVECLAQLCSEPSQGATCPIGCKQCFRRYSSRT
ncbi:ferrochelatase [Neorickettsia helminthoeca str. Oregon]|uniref:Ferrochelatase n=1 Tax=Neorickettsia helminthoeca str. Oregon TaxID=1286528 RepID=X5HMI2_9RICK|nr:ferrochelatase [Neorickettsia helminthoeca]AHX11680.1 ferrochelatase [Neorickettsia helminthoeca str. Oregon]